MTLRRVQHLIVPGQPAEAVDFAVSQTAFSQTADLAAQTAGIAVQTFHSRSFGQRGRYLVETEFAGIAPPAPVAT